MYIKYHDLRYFIFKHILQRDVKNTTTVLWYLKTVIFFKTRREQDLFTPVRIL
jgi:hypothetical protein